MSAAVATGAKTWGVTGWTYNRANFQFDNGLRWQRYTCGRKMACAQTGLFRQDITDLASVSMGKLKTYGCIYGIVITVCVTVFVEGRSGLKFPGPPVFISAIYLQCLAVGMGFMALAAWLLFHAAIRAQIACVQLRTRIVRVPVPTQSQLDNSRKLSSTWEEQGLYDVFRIPFVMPNGSNSPECSDEEDECQTRGKGYKQGGIPGVASKLKSKVKAAHEKGSTSRMPGLTPGNPSWYEKELKEREEKPASSPSGFGRDGAPEPYEHFELLRAAQKDWWGCEAYMRICFLFGMMHLVMAFSYWITLHNICELGMVWCSNLGAAGLTAGVWIIFRLDVLPEHGGCLPFEIGGPFVTSIALGMMYSHTVTQTVIDIARGVAMLIIIMHITLTFRMYSVSKPTGGRAHHQAKESGGRLFNQSAACDAPSWLPQAFQHVMYLVAPPKTQAQLAKEQHDRDNNAIEDEALGKVDMTPWYYLRTMIFAVGLGWLVQLSGRSVEAVMGERMIVSNPGAPPWTRTGMWYGWEHGPISSKHYAHITPQRGHWAWQKGWGPQGQQELWASDVFGFHPEADMHWAEEIGPEPKIGVAGVGPNTWASGTIAYGMKEPQWGPHHEGNHDWMNSGGHRRLHGEEDEVAAVSAAPARPVVPIAVQWPQSFEPDHLVCGPLSAGAPVAALTAGGTGALLARGAALLHGAGEAAPFTLGGLLELGMARSVTWTNSSLLVVTGTGAVAACPHAGEAGACSALGVPPLPGLTAAVHAVGDGLRAAVAEATGGVKLLDLNPAGAWREMGSVRVPVGANVVSVAATQSHLLVTAADGTAFKWALREGVPAHPEPVVDTPGAGARRTWQSSCLLPSGKLLRLASSWQRAKGGPPTLSPELLL